ncbi:interaptin [Mycetomoellerius zeteki]|uniref:interaptin n=1 Tax=Mycetomoellerius zeteki TaxID=64791 RepID=UPI00084E7081|nr:PREDICTED: interaptin-like [Trachymyrmex zeteki]
MVPSKPRRSESRRSSILKPCKPRQPLQNVNFDSSSNENSPTASKIKRRVSFAEKKHVKEFCHSTEQGTVWDNTYEEHDSILKGSFVIDQNAEGIYLVNNQLPQGSIARANEETNDTNCNLDFTAVPNKSCVSNDWVSSNIVYNNSDTEYTQLPDEESQFGQIIIDTSKSVKSSNIIIYRDSDEEDREDNVAKKCPSKLYSNNVDSELDKTRVQDFSMELTAPISASLVSSHLYMEEQKKQECNENINNSGTNTTNYNHVSMECTTNCNNVSMDITEAVPIFAKSVASNLGIFEQIPTILHNCEHTKWNATNTHNTIFPTNLQSDNVSRDISEHIPDVGYANDSMVLTSVIQSFTDATDTDIYPTNNTIFDTSMEMIMVPSKMNEKKANNKITVKENDLREDQTDKTEIFIDVLMEMTKPTDTILFSNVYNKESRVDEPISRDDRTTFFHNVSMEMTKIVSTRNKQKITDRIICKSSEENTGSKRDINRPDCFNEKTLMLCKSMEFTEALPVPSCQERMFHAAHIAHSNKSTCEIEKNDKTKFFNDANLKIDESISKNDKTILFPNVSMEMTTAVSRKEITQSICKSISKENTHGEKDKNNSICFNEGTKLLCKSMEFTEVVPISLHDITFNTTDTIHTTQSVSFSQTLSKTISLPAENSVRVSHQTDVVASETIQDISMEITAAVPSTLHLAQDVKVNETENLIISKNDEFQYLMTNNNLTELRKDVTKENFTISREIVEAKNIRHDELSNISVTQFPLNNLDYSLSTNLENANSKKRMSDDNEKSYSKRVRSSFMEIQSSQKSDVHSFSSTGANYVNDLNDIEQEHNEYSVKETIDHTQISDSNLRNSLDEISKYSFSRKSLPYLEDSFVELQSIKPPSFIHLDSEEERSFHEIQHEFQSSITDIPVNITSNQLTVNNVTGLSNCSINSRENAANDYFTILRKKEEPINTENNHTEDCHENTVMDKTENNQEIDCQAMMKTIINDNQLNKSNYDTTKNINEKSILSMNAKDGKTVTVQDLNHSTSLIIKEIEVIAGDQVEDRNEKEYIRKKLNEDTKLQNNIKEQGQYLDKIKQETKKRSDHLEGTGVVIEDQINPEKHRINLNNEMKQQNMRQKDKCATEGLVTAHNVSTINEDIKNGTLIEDPFVTVLQKLETRGAGDDCIWNVYYNNINRKMIVFGFIANSLLIAIFLSYDFNDSEKNLIKEIKIISRLSDDAGVFIKLVHKLILEKINAELLTSSYKTHQDILPMLNFISQDVKLAMDFKFDLRRLDDLNLMEITNDEISFVSRSKRLDIILKVTIKIKRFDKLTPNDVNCYCILGRIKETDIKNLIKNVKRDHKFLRRYMNDVKDYIDIMGETFK